MTNNVLTIGKSRNAPIILGYMMEKGSTTLYDLMKEKGMRQSSIYLAFQTLQKNNLICFSPSDSQKRIIHARVYLPTFKGALFFLSKHELVDIGRQVSGLYLSKELNPELEQDTRFQNELKKTLSKWSKSSEDLRDILLRYGETFDYPLLKYCTFLEYAHFHLYEIFVMSAERVLRNGVSLPLEYHDFADVVAHKKAMEYEKDLGEGKVDLKKVKKRFEEAKREVLEEMKVNEVENNLLERAFFWEFLKRGESRRLQSKIVNKEVGKSLYPYAASIVKEKEDELNREKRTLRKWKYFTL